MAQRNGAPDKSTQCSPVSSTSTTPSVAVDDADLGGVQRLRSAEVIDPDAVPPPPTGAVPVEPDERAEVVRVAGTNVSELLGALDYIAENPDVCAGSPNTSERAGRIAGRIRRSMEAETRLDDTLTVTRQQRGIAVSDGHKLVVDLADDVRHSAKRDPTVAKRHAKVVAYAELPSQAVRNGIARTRAKKAKADKKAQAKKPDSDKPTA